MILLSVTKTFFLTLSSVRCLYLFVYSIIICQKVCALCYLRGCASAFAELPPAPRR